MSRLLNRFSLLTVAAIVCLASSATAGTIRDDGFDSDYLALGNSSLYDSVGQFTGSTNAFNFSASGVLIASNWVLTAGHVVSDSTSLSFDIGGKTYDGESWISHPKWDGNLGKGYDIGLVQLTENVPGEIEPAERYTGNGELGLEATSVGFGKTGTGLTGDTLSSGTKRAGENVVDVWLRTPGRTPRVFMSDFDSPNDPAESHWGSDEPLDLEYLIAPGDSGGGVFANIGGSELLIGIHSFGASYDGLIDSDYGDISGHTRVSAFNKWIDQILGGTDDGGGGNGGGKGNGKKPRSEFAVDLNGLASAPVPEPSTMAMLTLCGLCLFGRWWRKRQA